jgi:hypothetical protein
VGEPSGADADDSTLPIWLGLHVRLAQLSLEHALARHDDETRAALSEAARSHGRDPGTAALVIPRIGNWFRLLGEERVNLPGKLCRILRTLATQQPRAPGAPLSIEELIERGMPRVRICQDPSFVQGSLVLYRALAILNLSR